MVYDAREFARLRNCGLSISAIAWIVILVEPNASAICSPPGSSIPWRLLLASTPATSLAKGWALMLIAMMSPILVPPIYHVCLGSFARRRARSIAFFVAGYGAVWMAAGGVLLAVELARKGFAPQSYLPAAVAGLVALVWQTSPFKQTCLNRCHRHRPFAAFGIASDWELLCIGAEHGLWCAGSCSALMLFPMLLPEGHYAAMGAAGALMYCERLDRPKTPSWRWRGFGTAFRYLNLRWRGPGCGPAPSALGVKG
jgi:predicted metal-binding membrane protein